MIVARILFWLLLVTLMPGAVALTVLRVLQLEQGWAVRIVSFTPYAVLGYGVVALLCVVAAFRARDAGRRGSPRTWLTVALIVLLPLGLHGWWLAPEFIDDREQIPDGPVVTVMTANLLKGHADPLAVLSAASERGVDVLVLQEITPRTLATLDDSGLDLAMPFRAGDSKETVEGTMIFSRWPLRDEVRTSTGYDGYAVTVEHDLGEFRFFGVHPRPPIGPAYAWRGDLENLLAEVEEAMAGELPVLLAGDLNATPDHREVRAFADAGLRRVGELIGAGWQPTWPSEASPDTFPGWVPPLVQIDHVMVDARFVPLDLERVFIPGSDHMAVVARVARVLGDPNS
ncbi:endonuclease/exonuclease/phosphatase family protein [Nocardioides limicola]|uniref:endonuclease/exonuclease/phosphatase family protein n=1 Tax=Nocardioides limicola TaxID=2803368 RepID=UPI00193B84F9|nr:endonuclease/exonuclease/phosphatase family protein [Nocardioides sp. DJM-14]